MEEIYVEKNFGVGASSGGVGPEKRETGATGRP
jgi:hypothetical protein